MTRRIQYLFVFLAISLLLGYPMYRDIVEGDFGGAALMFVTLVISSFISYAAYVGWIPIGTSVVIRERYSGRSGQHPLTRDEEILNQFALFLQNIESVVRDEDIEQ